MNRFKQFFKNSSGQGVVEYGLILALVSVVAIVSLTLLGGGIKDKFDGINTAMGGSSEVVVPEETDPEVIAVLAEDSDFTWVEDNVNGYWPMPGPGDNGYFVYTGSKTAIIIPDVIQGNTYATSYYGMFGPGSSPVVKVESTNPAMASTKKMFSGNTMTGAIDLTGLNTSGVTDMTEMFSGSSMKSINLEGIDTSKVTHMIGAFQDTKATDINLAGWNTLNADQVDGMRDMFTGSLVSVIDISSFDILSNSQVGEAFNSAVATIGYAKDVDTAERLNGSPGKPVGLIFTVK